MSSEHNYWRSEKQHRRSTKAGYVVASMAFVLLLLTIAAVLWGHLQELDAERYLIGVCSDAADVTECVRLITESPNK